MLRAKETVINAHKNHSPSNTVSNADFTGNVDGNFSFAINAKKNQASTTAETKNKVKV